MATNTMASVNIRCILDNRYAIIGVGNNKSARFEIETKKIEEHAEPTKRNSINLVLVIDRSGSMASNNKLEFSKQAILSVLNSIDDDDKVQIIFEDASGSVRQVLHSTVEGVRTGGLTNLSDGMKIFCY